MTPDRHLQRIPRRFTVDGQRVNFFKPQAMGQWSSAPGAVAVAPAAQCSPQPAALSPGPPPAGPRPIRLRHYAARPPALQSGQQDRAVPALTCITWRRLFATAACPVPRNADVRIATLPWPNPPLAWIFLASIVPGTSIYQPPCSASRPRVLSSSPRGRQRLLCRWTGAATQDPGHGEHGAGDVRAGQQQQTVSMQASALTGARHPLHSHPQQHSVLHRGAQAAASAAAIGSGGSLHPRPPTMPRAVRRLAPAAPAGKTPGRRRLAPPPVGRLLIRRGGPSLSGKQPVRGGASRDRCSTWSARGLGGVSCFILDGEQQHSHAACKPGGSSVPAAGGGPGGWRIGSPIVVDMSSVTS